jgi:hypothetical protein
MGKGVASLWIKKIEKDYPGLPLYLLVDDLEGMR